MASQIIFFKKNKIDLEAVDTSIIVTDSVASNNGQEFVQYMRNRNNFSAWMTTDSTDAALTQLDISLGDQKLISDIILVGHNLKNYTIQYRSGIGSFLNFSTTIAPTADDNSTTYYTFGAVQATDVRIIINGTQVADEDKTIKQLIITERLGKFEGWPQVRSPEFGTNKKVTEMLSGKSRVVEMLENFRCTLDVRHWRKANDIALIEQIYFARSGVLMWINSNNPEQFFTEVRGYRKQDIFLVRPLDEYSPEFVSGIYSNGLAQSIKFGEVIT